MNRYRQDEEDREERFVPERERFSEYKPIVDRMERRAWIQEEKRRAQTTGRRRNAMVGVAVVLFLLMMFGLFALLTGQDDSVEVPFLIDLPFVEAQEELKSAGLSVIVEYTGERTVDLDSFMVADQDPDPGKSIKSKSSVTLYLVAPPNAPGPGSSSDADRALQADAAPAAVQHPFDVNQAMAHVTHLCSTIGWREQGTDGEEKAARYIQEQLEALGYRTRLQAPISIPVTGRTSQNVIATLEGTQRPDRVIVVGAHMDTVNGPGANDNATGCGALLELAGILKQNRRHVPAIEFVFFGAEEVAQGGSSNDHHYGSRHYVAVLSDEEKSRIAGMISVDMVGAGDTFLANSMGLSSPVFKDMMLEHGAPAGMGYRKDPGWSDHEPFERAGIPAVWIQFRGGHPYHSPADNLESVNVANLEKAGRLLQDFFESYLTPERVDLL